MRPSEATTYKEIFRTPTSAQISTINSISRLKSSKATQQSSTLLPATPRSSKRPADSQLSDSILERLDSMDQKHRKLNKENQKLIKRIETMESQRKLEFPTSIMCNGSDLLEEFYAKTPDLYALKIAPVIFGEKDLANGLITDDGKPMENSKRKPVCKVKVLGEAVMAKFQLTNAQYLSKFALIKKN